MVVGGWMLPKSGVNRSRRIKSKDYLPFTNYHSLKNYPPVPGPSCDALAVEVFEERDGILARDAGEFFEGRNVNQALRPVARAVVAKRDDETFESVAVEEEVFAHAHERTGFNEELEDFSQVLAATAFARRGA